MNPIQHTDIYISTGQAGKLLGVDTATIRNYARAGLLGFHRLPSGYFKIERASVERLRKMTERPANQN